MARRHRTTVRLVGIRLREQGTHDSFCAYYAAAMMLCTLRPEMDDEFDATHVARDPLFRNLPRRRGQSLDRAVADWLTAGVHFGPLARALGRACGGATRFRAAREPFTRKTLDALRERVDKGLPSVLGWESGELGDHTVLVVGYDRCASASRQGWLRVLDPTGKLDVLEWRQLARIARAPADLIVCTKHDGWRPDRLSVDRDVEGAHLGSRIERWNLHGARWEPIVTRAPKRA
ncbi:MAG TPA: hypothetical protein VGH28_06175 [Polyangiaceae bacterium]|jgi:hypothetical protein